MSAAAPLRDDDDNERREKKNDEAGSVHLLRPLVAEVRRSDRSALRAAPPVALTAGRNSGAKKRAANNNDGALTVLPGNSSSSAARSTHPQKGKGGGLVIYNNPTKDVMYQPSFGPARDDLGDRQLAVRPPPQSSIAFDEATFHEQRVAFQRDGKALAPTDDGREVVRTTLGYSAQRLEQFVKLDEERRKRPRPNNKVDDKGKTKKEPLVYGSDDEVEHGIWAPPSREERWEADNARSDMAKGGIEGLAPEQLAEREYLQERDRQRGLWEEQKEEESTVDRLVERKMRHLLPPRMESETPMEASTVFHGPEEFDYKGRSWMAAPAGLGGAAAESTGDLDVDHHKCFVPKKCIHRFTGHDKGVHRIRLFPRTGHLILSAGLEGKCKVWSIERKQVMRTYIGHSAAVRDVQFNRDGTKFVSASFDRFLRLWDTETGAVLQTFTNRKVPYCVKFYPKDDNIFVVGCSDNKIVAYDSTTAEITQEYTHHLAPVNAILFVDDHGTKMISSSDDKKILIWEWDIGVPIKYISDPTMHSMPCLALHPAHGYFCGQSLDNTIAVFQANQRFALQRKKKFSGHITSGYACELTFSPDGQYLMSGDGNGALFVWDWKRHRILQKFKAHSGGPCIGCVWHPLEPSVAFTCGWDGTIKMWQ